MTEKGHISIHTENILPIIKKWLYSEKEIFLRELVANAADAITKLEKLALLGETTNPHNESRITIQVDKDKKQITITDTGLGLTADEVKKYINQVAFSGVKDFVAKYQGKDEESQVIGHFGLGFYSSFMVAEKVEIDSLSHQSGAKAAHWSCDGSTEFVLNDSSRTVVGTTITLHIAEDSLEMLEASKIREILRKYCAFIRFPIYLQEEMVNEPRPLWTKNPSELKDDDYKEFFTQLFPQSAEPLFWIHLNVDYPFKLRGILYFPQLQHELEASQGEVKLFCNQVYVADNPKELVPEFLTLLKGVIDCPDLPLNVSRSYLQNDPQARKIKEHISKKVADRLTGMAKTEKEIFEKYWEDISPFVKYGMMRDSKFQERLKDFLIFKSSSGEYTTLDAYLERMKDKTDGKVIYASDESLQSSYLAMLKENDVEAIIATTVIDQHFLPYMEMQSAGKLKFQRIDADVLSHVLDQNADSKIVDKDNKTSHEKVTDLFTKHLGDKKVKIRVESLKSTKVPAMILVDENVRRIKEMGMFGALPSLAAGFEVTPTLVVNSNSAAVKNLLQMTHKLAPNPQHVEFMVQHIYDLAYMQHNKFTPDAMQAFIERSAVLLGGFNDMEAKPTHDSL